MRRAPESLPLRTSLLHDISTLAILSVILVPFYMLLNQYWKSLTLLVASYGILGLAFVRLGRYMRRVMRRAPAEIPPWTMTASPVSPLAPPAPPFAAAEAMQSVSKDPRYLEDVLKPRLRQLLAYRVLGNPHLPLDAFEATHCLEPAVLEFLRDHGRTGLWSRYYHRQQRVRNVLSVLRYLETL